MAGEKRHHFNANDDDSAGRLTRMEMIVANAYRSMSPLAESCVRTFTAVIERDEDTGLLVGYVPGWPGAHSQGASVEELDANLREVVALLFEDGEPKLESEFIGTRTLQLK